MNLRSFSIVIAFVMPISLANGDDSIAKELSSEAHIAAELDKYEMNVRSLDRSFQAAISHLKESYLADRSMMRKSLTKKLSNEKQILTEKGELDRAILVRDQIEKIAATEIVPPHSQLTETNGSRSPMLSKPAGILGTWRWNNGVDIKNLEHGKTNGNGSWQLVDAREQVYQFQWKQIPADRVKLSPDGRVLEGTKANDLGFRVWAVRID